MDWSKYFIYDETSPTSLAWAVARYGGLPHNRICVVDIGDVAGCINVHGYGEVKLNGKSYKTHRIIWEMSNPTLKPGEDLDHIDGDRLNNRLTNLRVCNDKVNSQNRVMRSDNTSGVTGVTRIVSEGTRSYWTAKWTSEDGRELSRSFRIDVHGNELALDMATKHREKMIRQLAQQGQHYTERHGK